ncbi:hypothetical protein AB0K09_19650 [Streptomyces sp. NPDC049577]|uniref:hypothetical protein n=1 Tax=Streptomyces sp. NPDC049577 TaxID=3155153 RepID=UPI003434E51C
MSASDDPLASARPDPAAVNAEIRAFLTARRGRALTPSERAEYEALRALWVEAVRAGLGKAA